jgi:hypothetical protein
MTYAKKSRERLRAAHYTGLIDSVSSQLNFVLASTFFTHSLPCTKFPRMPIYHISDLTEMDDKFYRIARILNQQIYWSSKQILRKQLRRPPFAPSIVPAAAKSVPPQFTQLVDALAAQLSSVGPALSDRSAGLYILILPEKERVFVPPGVRLTIGNSAKLQDALLDERNTRIKQSSTDWYLGLADTTLSLEHVVISSNCEGSWTVKRHERATNGLSYQADDHAVEMRRTNADSIRFVSADKARDDMIRDISPNCAESFLYAQFCLPRELQKGQIVHIGAGSMVLLPPRSAPDKRHELVVEEIIMEENIDFSWQMPSKINVSSFSVLPGVRKNQI